MENPAVLEAWRTKVTGTATKLLRKVEAEKDLEKRKLARERDFKSECKRKKLPKHLKDLKKELIDANNELDYLEYLKQYNTNEHPFSHKGRMTAHVLNKTLSDLTAKIAEIEKKGEDMLGRDFASADCRTLEQTVQSLPKLIGYEAEKKAHRDAKYMNKLMDANYHGEIVNRVKYVVEPPMTQMGNTVDIKKEIVKERIARAKQEEREARDGALASLDEEVRARLRRESQAAKSSGRVSSRSRSSLATTRSGRTESSHAFTEKWDELLYEDPNDLDYVRSEYMSKFAINKMKVDFRKLSRKHFPVKDKLKADREQTSKMAIFLQRGNKLS